MTSDEGWRPPEPGPAPAPAPAPTIEPPTIEPPIAPPVAPPVVEYPLWQPGPGFPPDAVQYGPHIGSEADLRLLGQLEGKRVLELGVGAGYNTVALARLGAKVIGIDESAERLAAARRRIEEAEARVELHQGDFAELAFLRADSVDLVFCAYALSRVEDRNRVFRQTHRVLRHEAPLVLSLPHPAAGLEHEPRSYGRPTINDVFTGLVRANFRVDALLEPEPVLGSRGVPGTLVLRARKEGT